MASSLKRYAAPVHLALDARCFVAPVSRRMLPHHAAERCIRRRPYGGGRAGGTVAGAAGNALTSCLATAGNKHADTISWRALGGRMCVRRVGMDDCRHMLLPRPAGSGFTTCSLSAAYKRGGGVDALHWAGRKAARYLSTGDFEEEGAKTGGGLSLRLPERPCWRGVASRRFHAICRITVAARFVPCWRK